MDKSHKDPAFLFYSKDFYEGTRMMMPEERACYVDLMIYQHQNGPIPNDLKRLKLYCSGIDEATLIATLEAKFNLTLKGWVNKRLEKEVLDRQNFKKEQSKNGAVGQFWKKMYQIFSKKDIEKLKKNLSKDQITKLLETVDLKDINTLKATLEASLKHRLSNKANEDANVNEIKSEDKSEDGGVGEGEEILIAEPWPTFDDFWDEYDKKVGPKDKLQKKWDKIKQAEREKIMQYIPLYRIAEPRKKFRKNPETFLNNESWNDEIINDNGKSTKEPTVNRQTADTAFRNSQNWDQQSDRFY